MLARKGSDDTGTTILGAWILHKYEEAIRKYIREQEEEEEDRIQELDL